MSGVNSRRDSRPSEKRFHPRRHIEVNSPPARNGGIPGLQREDPRTERLFAYDVLAEGEELSSNPLRPVFNDLHTTQFAVDVD
jgi:hypothetical protein